MRPLIMRNLEIAALQTERSNRRAIDTLVSGSARTRRFHLR